MEQESRLDTTAAEAYEKYIVPAFMLPLINGVVDGAAPRPGERVLDVACGTGLVARLVTPRLAPGGAISSLDFDPAMISVARGLIEHAPDVNITWHCADALSMPFDDGEFELVFCLNGLQFLPDHAAGLAEMHRVMKPGGRLTLTVFNAVDRCKGHFLLRRCLDLRGVDPTPLLKPFALGNADNLQTLAGDAGFQGVSVRVVRHVVRFPSARDFLDAIAAGGVSARHVLGRLPADERAGLVRDMEAAFSEYEEERSIALPHEQLVLTAHAD